MRNAIEVLQSALKRGMAVRPQVGGFPYLAESLRVAGVKKNIWTLPSCESIYLTESGPVVMVGEPLLTGMELVPPFNREALVTALRTDQAGKTTFPEFLQSTWKAGVVRYVVDFAARKVTYYGCHDEAYTEDYSAVDLPA